MRTHATVPAVVLAIVVSLTAIPARAQTGVFAGGGGATTGIWFTHVEQRSPVSANSDVSGRVGEWFITGGGTVARHAVLQTELTMRGTLKKDVPTPQYPPPGPYGTTTRTVSYRFRDVSFLAGYTSGSSHKVNVSALAGVMFSQIRFTEYSIYTPPTPGPYPTYPTDSTTVSYYIAPVFGLDVPIAPASRLLIVPQVRTFKLPGGGPLAVSTGLGARVRF